MVTELRPKISCFDQAHDALEKAKDSPNQDQAMLEAIEILMTKDCKTVQGLILYYRIATKVQEHKHGSKQAQEWGHTQGWKMWRVGWTCWRHRRALLIRVMALL